MLKEVKGFVDVVTDIAIKGRVSEAKWRWMKETDSNRFPASYMTDNIVSLWGNEEDTAVRFLYPQSTVTSVCSSYICPQMEMKRQSNTIALP